MTPFALVAVLALAQAATKPAAPPPPPPPPPPYEAELLRLAEVMGALSFLRDLCHDGDGAAFRERAARLIEADPRAEDAKAQLAGAFNRGFEGYRLTYRACTASARDAIGGYLEESQRLAREVAGRYGGG